MPVIQRHPAAGSMRSEVVHNADQNSHLRAGDRAHPTDQDEVKPITNQSSHDSHPFSIKFELNFLQWSLFIAALGMRLWQLGIPRAVVFDELHYKNYISYYMKSIFFFDFNPPFGKMLLALSGTFFGYGGDDIVERIGEEYSSTVPVFQLRLLPALLGSFLVPISYQILVELGYSHWAGLAAGLLLLLDNAILVQSRFMLMESMLLFYISLSILALLKFKKVQKDFSLSWWLWLCVMGVSYTCALSTKYNTVYTSIIILYIIGKDYWRMLADTTKSDLTMIYHLLARGYALIVLPAVLYMTVFYVHLSLLYKAGPHDNIMTSAFQASLEGGLASITKGQPLQVAYGSQITLRHVEGQPCWLHSHLHVYPVRYSDSRGSSHQQQVTCYSFKDINNWWIIKHPKRESLMVDDIPQAVKHGDVIQLVHGTSRRALNSHDVAAPVSPQCQEVSCYIDYNVSMPTQNLWKVNIVNRESDGATWQTIRSTVHLIHVNTSYALKVSWKHLPEWGFNQLEVVTDKLHNQPDTLWNVEEHRYTKSEEIEDQERELTEAELIPLEPTHLSFWAKFTELQYRMLTAKTNTEMEHRYSSAPWEWPLMTRNVAYWVSQTSNAQIQLLGNPVIWYTATLSVMSYLVLLVFYMMRRRRLCYDLSEEDWEHYVFVGELFVGGYFLHFLPHLAAETILFLHHYLPSLLYKILLIPILVEHVYIQLDHRFPKAAKFLQYVIVLYFVATFIVFRRLTPLCYGNTQLTYDEVKSLEWFTDWDFIAHQKT